MAQSSERISVFNHLTLCWKHKSIHQVSSSIIFVCTKNYLCVTYFTHFVGLWHHLRGFQHLGPAWPAKTALRLHTMLIFVLQLATVIVDSKQQDGRERASLSDLLYCLHCIRCAWNESKYCEVTKCSKYNNRHSEFKLPPISKNVENTHLPILKSEKWSEIWDKNQNPDPQFRRFRTQVPEI